MRLLYIKLFFFEKMRRAHDAHRILDDFEAL